MMSMDRAAEPQAEMVQLHEGVYAYLPKRRTWGWSNAGLIVGENCALVVDTLFTPHLTQRFLAQAYGVTDKKIKFLVNTHRDGDHCFGNHLLPEATSIAHANARAEILEEGSPDPCKLQLIFPEFDFAGARFTVPDIGFEGTLTVELGKRQARLLHLGFAHSRGDIAVHVPEEKVIFCGDLLFNLSTPVAGNGYLGSWIEALTKLAEMDIAVYVPGHGPVTDRAGVLKCREYLVLIEQEGKKGYTAGRSPKQTAREVPLGEFKAWANPERILLNIDRVYRECRGEKPALLLERDAIFKEMADWGQALVAEPSETK